MPRGINLLVAQKKVSVERLRLLRYAKVSSLVLLVFYCLVAVGIFSFWLVTMKESQKVEEEIVLKREKINNLKRIESLQMLLKQRLSLLESLSNQKTADYQSLLTYFEQFPKEISLGDISLEEEGKVGVSGDASNVLALSNFLEEIAEEETLFSQVILTTLSREKEGSYSFSLDLQARI